MSALNSGRQVLYNGTPTTCRGSAVPLRDGAVAETNRPNRVSIDLSYGTSASAVTAAQQIMPANQANERTTGILSQ